MTRRREDWAERLAACMEAARPRAFAYGHHDCATFAAECVHAMTDAHVGRAWLAAYRDPRGAKRLLKDNGLLAMVSEILGEPIAPVYTQRGDVVLYVHPEHGDALGVCNGMDFAAPGDAGLEFAPMEMATHAWRVG